MRLHLGGHLSWYDPQKRSWLELAVSEPAALIELVRQLKLPPEEIALTVVNGRAVLLDEASVSDADRVELYPPIGGGSGAIAIEPPNRVLDALKRVTGQV